MELLKDLLGATLRNPREGMRQVLNLSLSRAMALSALLLVAVLSGLLIHFSILLMSPADRQLAYQIFGTPFQTAGVQFGALFFAILLIWQVGRWRGGEGDFTGSVLVMVWLQVLMTLLQLVQILISFAAPPLAALFGYVAIGAFCMLMAQFIAELHRFRSAGLTFLGMVLTAVAALLILSLLLSTFLDPEVLIHGF